MDTTGPVLEIGCGKWSTPICAAFCKASEREFLSIDEDRRWAKPPTKFVRYDDVLPRLAADGDWSVVLMDHSPGERRPADALRFLGAAEYVVCHDYAKELEAAYAPAVEAWPFYKVNSRFSPRTLVLGARAVQ